MMFYSAHGQFILSAKMIYGIHGTCSWRVNATLFGLEETGRLRTNSMYVDMPVFTKIALWDFGRDSW
jgi:hypothetical protein